MNKNLIIAALVVAGISSTTACGSKSSYRSIKASVTEKKVLPPIVDASTEEQALKILQKDSQFQSTRASQQTLSLQQSIKAVSVAVEATREDKDTSVVQANVSLMTVQNDETCVPAVKKSVAINKSEFGKKEIKIENFGRIKCVDKSCENVILIVEKQGDSFSEQQSTVFGAVAILLSKDKTTGHFEAVSTESDTFLQVEKVEDRVTQCEKNKEQKPEGDEKAVRIQEIQTEIKKIDTEIELHKQGKIISNLNASAARIAELTAKKKTLVDELNQLQGKKEVKLSPVPDQINEVAIQAKLNRIKAIDARIADIDKEIALHKQGKIISNLDTIALRINELNKEKTTLQTEKSSLNLNL